MRDVSVQRTARDTWTLRVGDTELTLNPCEAWLLEHALRDAVFPESQRQRLQTALRTASSGCANCSVKHAAARTSPS